MNRDGGDGTTYLINDVSQRVDLSQKRIREYEKARFIKPERAPRTNNRLYTESDIQRIMRVKELIHRHGFTVACLQHFMAAAPCWTIFNCPERQACPAYQSPHIPCYEAAKDEQGPAERDCQRCPVYMNRDLERITLMEKI